MLTLQDVRIVRGSRAVINGLTAEAGSGEIVALLGANGTGKTTLLNYISGSLKADIGALAFNGITYDPLSMDWKRQVSFVPDDGGIIPLLTVEEQILLQCALEGLTASEARTRLESLLSIFGLGDVRNYRGNELSLGTQKRLGLVLGLVRNSELYIFDEPLNSLDTEGAGIFRGILQILRSRMRMVLVSSHNVSFIYPLCDRIWNLTDNTAQVYPDKTEFNYHENLMEYEIDMPWLALKN